VDISMEVVSSRWKTPICFVRPANLHPHIPKAVCYGANPCPSYHLGHFWAWTFL